MKEVNRNRQYPFGPMNNSTTNTMHSSMARFNKQASFRVTKEQKL